MTTPRLNASFIMVPCRCGRVLRAKWDQVGSEIRCWDCHQTNLVVIPQARRRIVSQILRAIFYLFNGPGTGDIVLAALFLTVGLMVPFVGLALGTVLMICGAAVYGDLLESEHHLGPRFEIDWTRIYRRLTRKRLMTFALFVAGSILPLWLIGAGFHRSPHLSFLSLPILILSWTLLPIVMIAVSIKSDTPEQKLSERFKFLRAHPLITLIILAIVPSSLLISEAVIGGLFYKAGTLPFFTLEHMPIPGNPLLLNGGVYYDYQNFVYLPQDQFIEAYRSGLRHGYSFVAAIPPSLSIPTNAGLDPVAIQVTREYYLFLRFILVFGVTLVMTLSFAIQARCLSVLVNANRYGGD